MLICIDNAHFSFVADHHEKESLLVRAKHAGDIKQYWPDAKVITDEGVDFMERAVIPRYKVAGLLSELIMGALPADMQLHDHEPGSPFNLQNYQPAIA